MYHGTAVDDNFAPVKETMIDARRVPYAGTGTHPYTRMGAEDSGWIDCGPGTTTFISKTKQRASPVFGLAGSTSLD